MLGAGNEPKYSQTVIPCIRPSREIAAEIEATRSNEENSGRSSILRPMVKSAPLVCCPTEQISNSMEWALQVWSSSLTATYEHVVRSTHIVRVT